MEFSISIHTETGKPVVDAWQDGKFIASIYSHDGGIKIVSKYLDGVEQEPGYPPAVVVHLSQVKEADEG